MCAGRKKKREEGTKVRFKLLLSADAGADAGAASQSFLPFVSFFLLVRAHVYFLLNWATGPPTDRARSASVMTWASPGPDRVTAWQLYSTSSGPGGYSGHSGHLRVFPKLQRSLEITLRVPKIQWCLAETAEVDWPLGVRPRDIHTRTHVFSPFLLGSVSLYRTVHRPSFDCNYEYECIFRTTSALYPDYTHLLQAQVH